jgi:hypothetical protein
MAYKLGVGKKSTKFRCGIALASRTRWSSSLVDIDRISVGSNGLVAFFDQIAVSKDVVRSKSWPKRGAGKKSMVGYGWISQELDHIEHYGKMYGHNTIYSYLLDINLANFHVKCVRDL